MSGIITSNRSVLKAINNSGFTILKNSLVSLNGYDLTLKLPKVKLMSSTSTDIPLGFATEDILNTDKCEILYKGVLETTIVTLTGTFDNEKIYYKVSTSEFSDIPSDGIEIGYVASAFPDLKIYLNGIDENNFTGINQYSGFNTLNDVRINLGSTVSLQSAGNQSLNCSTATFFRKTGGTATITLNNMTEGESVNLVMESTGSGYTITWSGETFRWTGTSIPTPTTTASRYDKYTFTKIGGVVYGEVILNNG